MIGLKLSHFQIISKIGEGGMGVVYKALDEKLGRHVALKVLQPEAMGNEERRLRFLREARTAAAVTHPNIAAIHEIDEAEGITFIAMELVEGQTLGATIRERPLPMRDALRIGIEIAEALARAHRAGVVHRDLKPDNVIISPDQHAKVLDFGLAKIVDGSAAAASTEGSPSQTISAEMTREGRVLGTAAYMSPEQARGLSVDSRSDIFSFGIVLYEMFTGRTPFRGATVTDTLTAILRDTPPPPSRLNPDFPPEAERVITKCLEKDPKDRYQHADEIAVDLRKLRRETDSMSVPRISGPVPAAASPERFRLRSRPVVLSVAGLLLAAAAGVLLFRVGWLPTAQAGVHALAVLPFENLKDGEDSQRLGQILQELIITDLSGLNSVRVLSSQRLLDVRKQIGTGEGGRVEKGVATQVAKQAGADRMITGSLSQLGEKWILTSQLIGVSDGAVVKSERIDGSDLYSMVDELTGRLRASLGVAHAPGEAVAVAVSEKTTASVEAYQHYLAGVERLNERDFGGAIRELGKAVEIDPGFGQALYKLAIARWWGGDLSGTPSEQMQSVKAIENMLRSNQKLTRKDRMLAEAIVPLLKHDYPAGRPLYERLVEEFPDEKEAWYGLGEALTHSPGGWRSLKAAAPFEKALELDPTFGLAYSHVRDAYEGHRMYAEARAKVRRLIERVPNDPTWYIEWVSWTALMGDRKETEAAVHEAFGKVAESRHRRDILMRVAAAQGRTGDFEGQKDYLEDALKEARGQEQIPVLVALGWNANARLRPREAEDHFRRAFDLDPKDMGALGGLARILSGERRFDELILLARSLAGKSPEFLPYLAGWAASALQKGDEGEAARALEKALAACKGREDEKWVYQGGAEAALEVGDVRRSEELLVKATKSVDAEDAARDGALLNLQGQIAFEQRRYDQAAERFRKALQVAPWYGWDQDMLRQTLLRQGDREGALEAARKAIEAQPENAWYRSNLVATYFGAGETAAAERALREGLDATPQRPLQAQLLSNAAGEFIRAGQLDRAAELTRESQELDREGWVFDNLGNLMEIARLRGRTDEALDQGRKLLEIAPYKVWALLDIAKVHLIRGETAEAERIVRDLLKTGPVHRWVHLMAAATFAEKGQWREAEAHAATAEAVLSGRTENALLGWILVAGGSDPDRGAVLARKALQIPLEFGERFLWPSFLAPPEHTLGLAHLRKKEFAEAVKMLEDAARFCPQRASIRADLEKAKARRAG